MPLSGAYIFPHGALTLNPCQYPFYFGVAELNKSCFQLANEIQSKNPDTIFLITPHGIALESAFGIYLNTSAKGSCEWKGAFSDFNVEAKIDAELSNSLLQHMQKNGIKAEGIVAYAEEEPLPLRWGEAIPLWFISQAYTNNSLEQKQFPKLVVMALPRKRNLIGNSCGGASNSVSAINSGSSKGSGFAKFFFGNGNSDGIEFVKECHKFGRHLGEFFNENKKNFVLVVSGDLAHKHVYPPQAIRENNIKNYNNFCNSNSNYFNNNINNKINS